MLIKRVFQITSPKRSIGTSSKEIKNLEAKLQDVSTNQASQNLNPTTTFLSDNIPNPYDRNHETCFLCKHELDVSYKNTRLISQFLSPFTGKIYGQIYTGLCAYQQARVSKSIRKARTMGFLPYTYKLPQYMKDPQLFDIMNPRNKNILN